jgi:hypothetical protein
MAAEKGKIPVQEEQKKKSHGRQFFGNKPGGDKKEGLPTLKYMGKETT